MELRDVDRFVREGKFAQALEAIDAVRASDPDNPYTAAYEVRVRALLEEARDNAYSPLMGAVPPHGGATAPMSETPGERVSNGTAGEMKRIAVLSRIADLLGSATGFLSKGEYDQALDALDQARVLDPGNKEIAVFEDRVRAARRDAMEMMHPSEPVTVVDNAPSEVAEMLATARAAAARGDFSEAFRSVTTAAILEPGNPDVARCETEIHAVQDRRRQASAEHQAAQVQRNHDAADRQAPAEITDADEERRHASAVIARHVERAQYLMESGEYGHALVEIDHAFLLNPLDPQIRRLQQEISTAQSRALQGAKDHAGTRSSIIAGFFADAHRLRARGKPEEALQAIGRILILDPTNAEAHNFEQRLQAEIAVAAPLRMDLPPVMAAVAELAPVLQGNESRWKRRKTYLVAGSFLAAAVVALFAVTQVLSWADAHKAQPGPPLPVVVPDSTLSPGLQAHEAVTRSVRAEEQKATAISAPSPSTDTPTSTPVTAYPGVLRLEQPDLPETALGADGTQRITVKVLVDQSGKPMLAAVVTSTHPAFDQPVINAVMQSEYVPWTGKDASKWITIPFTFTAN